MDRDGYEIVREFECCGKEMIIIKQPTGTHVMSLAEWKLVYGMLHPERWKNYKRVLKNRKTA